jgi:hypothetical protein
VSFICKDCLHPDDAWGRTKFSQGMGISHGLCECCENVAECVDASSRTHLRSADSAVQREKTVRKKTSPLDPLLHEFPPGAAAFGQHENCIYCGTHSISILGSTNPLCMKALADYLEQLGAPTPLVKKLRKLV